MHSLMEAIDKAGCSINDAQDRLNEAKETVRFLRSRVYDLVEEQVAKVTVKPVNEYSSQYALLCSELARIARNQGFSFVGPYHVLELVDGRDSQHMSILEALNAARLMMAQEQESKRLTDPDGDDPIVWIGFDGKVDDENDDPSVFYVDLSSLREFGEKEEADYCNNLFRADPHRLTPKF
ncbi:hypothetical protein LCGC14_1894120 [marine sediment metagenome]|uniref:Uncharacterized protein n=1 Tax=marine sediment metagenome TaxID=412755 RepID=A0A0F9FYU7_9ZZZZ